MTAPLPLRCPFCREWHGADPCPLDEPPSVRMSPTVAEPGIVARARSAFDALLTRRRKARP